MDFLSQVDEMLEKLSGILPQAGIVGTERHRNTWILRFLIGFKFNGKFLPQFGANIIVSVVHPFR